FPPVLLDIALVVSADVAAADVLTAIRSGAGPLLESARLFDTYADPERLGPGLKSLAFALRFRAADRTLTIEAASVARDAAVARIVVDNSVRSVGAMASSWQMIDVRRSQRSGSCDQARMVGRICEGKASRSAPIRCATPSTWSHQAPVTIISW